MVWIYLIVQAIGLGIIAWCFKVENKARHSATFGMVGLLTLFLIVVVAPLPVKLLTIFLIMLFLSRMNPAVAGSQTSLLSCFRTSLRVLTALGSLCLDPISRLIPEPLTRLLAHPVLACWQKPRTVNVTHPDMNIIDVEAIEVPHKF